MGGDFFIEDPEEAYIKVFNFRTKETVKIPLSKRMNLKEGDECQLEYKGIRIR